MSSTATKRVLIEKLPATGLAVLIFLSASFCADEKQLSIYSPAAIYTLPVVERSGREYIGLLEILEPLGQVRSAAKGRVLKLRYNSVEAEFVAGSTRARIHGRNFGFSAPIVMENSRGFVPLNSLNALLPLFLGEPVDFREGARRLFIGDVGIRISFKLEASMPPRLALGFSAPVNPTISTEAGKLRMVFKHDPVVSPGSQPISFDNEVITQASFSENNGTAELDVAANSPLMGSFSADRRTITIASVLQKAGSGIPNPATSRPAAAVATGEANSNGAASVSAINNLNDAAHRNGNSGSNHNFSNLANNAAHRILAVVDPAHGGDERGAALTDTLAEKDVTLGFARLLRHELETRGFGVTLLRDADISLTPDQRAAAANTAHANIYISLHAASEGSGARVYTALLPVATASAGVFRPWNAAQAPVLPVSRVVATAIADEFKKRQVAVQASGASLRPLNNVVVPAVAVELAPGPNGVGDVALANYQQRAAVAIAEAVASVRDQLAMPREMQREVQSGVQAGEQP